jgi:ABC-type Fe3+/spermidine/putrescine transport system ATPase subunit
MSILTFSPRANGETTAPPVRLSGVSKRYGDAATGVVALQDISLDVAPGEFVCLLGASGCGKTTLLNLVAGLDRPSVGTVEVPAGGAGPRGPHARSHALPGLGTLPLVDGDGQR